MSDENPGEKNLMESLRFLTPDDVRALKEEFGTPLFVYDEATLRKRAEEVLAFPNRYGLTARYAMKSCPTAAVLRIFTEVGLHIDASSGYEAVRAMRAGVPAENIQLTAQQLPEDLASLIDAGVLFNACSLHQLRVYGALFPNSEVSVRINPGLGSGHSNRTNVGGPSSSFGIWHEHLDEAKAIAADHNVRITGMHTHIGSGSDPETWVRCAHMSLEIAARLPEVTRFSLGGGYKVARTQQEIPADLQVIGQRVLPEFERFAKEQERELHLEIEPGSYLVANAAALVSSVIDVVDTGENGYHFLKLDTGMTDILRPSLYGAQHPIITIGKDRDCDEEADYLVVGHCCESGDVLTPGPGDPESLAARRLMRTAIGDLAVVESVGAYCSSMCAKNYNSFPESTEILRTSDGRFRVIRRRQTLDQILENEEMCANGQG
jgi:diaminopimelate decarboxylase